MFSGITQGLFIVNSLVKREGLLHYQVVLNQALVNDLRIGSSVAIDGVCQSVVDIQGVVVSFDAVQETLEKTTLKELFIHRKVSVERAMRFGDEIAGHELSGHIFTTGIVLAKKITPNNLCLSIQCSEACFAFVKAKGYIAVDGSSLTIGSTDKKNYSFEIHLIPETLRMTNFANKTIGDKVNIEPDMQTMLLVETVQSYYATVQKRLNKLEKKLAKIQLHDL